MKKKYKKSNYNIIVKNDRKTDSYILFNTLSGAMVEIDEREYNCYKEKEETFFVDMNEEEILSEMYNEDYLIDIDCDELKNIKYLYQNNRFSKDVLDLTIAPTLACNFKCPYCFEQDSSDRDLNPKRMSDEIQELLVDFVEKRLMKSKKIGVNWYGGEPLMSIGVIKSLTQNFIEICEKQNIEYEGSIVTNGYFLNKLSAKTLAELRIKSIQVTLDGPKKIHDRLRRLYNDGPTFERIVDNLLELQHDIFIAIRVNIDKNNWKYIEELKNELKSKGLIKYQLTFGRITSDNKEDDNVLSYEEFSKIWMKYDNLAYAQDLFGRLTTGEIVQTYCSADYDNSFIIDNSGNVYKCWRNIGQSSKKIFNLVEKRNYNLPLYYEYMSYDPTEDEKCKECKLLPLCSGGCPHERISEQERCPQLKYMIEDILLTIFEKKSNSI